MIASPVRTKRIHIYVHVFGETRRSICHVGAAVSELYRIHPLHSYIVYRCFAVALRVGVMSAENINAKDQLVSQNSHLPHLRNLPEPPNCENI